MSATKFGIEFRSVLTFLRPAGKNKWYIKLGVYQCECGNTTTCSISAVERGRIKSCGCLKKKVSELIGQKSQTHNLTKHPLYHIWGSIIARCENVNNTRYDRYMARGVRMCDEWRNNFKSFYDWCLANGWKRGLQIDKDIKGDGLLYSPDTCCIVTPMENSNKRANNKFETYKGQTKTIAEWGREKNMNPFLLYRRLRRGWSISDAIETPISSNSKNSKKCLSI